MSKTTSVKSKKINIICEDALVWLKDRPRHSIGNIITGIPDFDETNSKTLDSYINFIEKVAYLLFTRVKKDGYVLMANTDRKIEKKWVDKSFILQKVAEEVGITLRWHKIVLLRPVGSTHIQRPTYQHYNCFSFEAGPGEATPDVFLCGSKEYKNSSCSNVIDHSISFLKKYSPHKEVVDPFVGRGAILIKALKNGFSVIGIDIDPVQCKITTNALKEV